MSRIIAILFAWSVSLWGQVDATARVGVSVVERKLSLEDAIQMALRNNLEIEIERTNIATAETNVHAARGAFDTSLLYQPFWEARTTPTSSLLAAADGRLTERLFNNNFSVRQRVPWQGMSLHADFENGRASTNNPFTALNPYINSRLILGFTLPLLRGREIDMQRAEIRIRSKSVNVSESDLEARAQDVITRVRVAYWNLVGARQDVVVEEDGVRWGREQLARSQRMVDAGTLAPVELAASEAELQRRIDNFSRVLGQLTEAENALKVLIAPERQDSIWGDRLVPVDTRQIDPADATLKDAMETALKRRPELRSLELRKEANDIQQELSKDQLKPQVNFVGNYINAGLAGTVSTAPNPFGSSQTALIARLNQLSVLSGLTPIETGGGFGAGAPAAFIGGYGTALGNLFGGDYRTFQAGLQIEWSPRNRTAQANSTQAAIAEKRLRLQRVQAEQQIEAQVRNALQAIESARQRIQAAQASERAAKEKLDSEIRLFQTGESTNFLVITRQNEFLDSRRRVVAATTELNRAAARLEQATGTALEGANVRLR